MKVCITGITGFVGTYLTCALLNRYPGEVHILGIKNHRPSSEDTFWTILENEHWPKKDVQAYITIKQIDICEMSALSWAIGDFKPDVIIHLAAKTIVAEGHASPLEFVRTNILGTANILEITRTILGCRTIIQSTDKVYGEGDDISINAPLNPVDLYGRTKAAADSLAQYYIKHYKQDIFILRPPNLYGGVDLNTSRIVPDVITTCLKGKNPTLRGYKINPDGTKTFLSRMYMFIDEFLSYLIHIAFSKNVPEYRIFTLTSPFVFTSEEVAKDILGFFTSSGAELSIEYSIPPSLPEIFSQSMAKTHRQVLLENSIHGGYMNPRGRADFLPTIAKTIKRYKKFSGLSESLL